MQDDVVKYFLRLVSIDSESKNERAMMDVLRKDLEELGAEVLEDSCHKHNDGNAGNLYAFIPGKINKKPILFCAHADTVVPGNGIKPIVENGRIFTDGTTILGGDDKSGIAEALIAIKKIKDSGIDHAPIEVLITVSEEIGLIGAKCFNKGMLKSAFGYALDSHQVGELIFGAPSQNSFIVTIYGKEAHAGVEPEKGLNAIRIASEAISAMPNGRIDLKPPAISAKSMAVLLQTLCQTRLSSKAKPAATTLTSWNRFVPISAVLPSKLWHATTTKLARPNAVLSWTRNIIPSAFRKIQRFCS